MKNLKHEERINKMILNDYIYNRDQLRKRSRKTILDWPSLVFTAGADQEPFHELTIVTLYSYYDTRCHELAVDQVPFEQNWEDKIHKQALRIMDNGLVKVREMVAVDKSYKTLVILDDLEITDLSTDRALGLLEKSKVPGVTHFGNLVSFTSDEMIEYYKHCQKKQEVYFDATI